MENQRLERVLSSPRLPSLPTVAIKILELVQKEDVTVAELAETIGLDPALAGKVLKAANSPLYAQSRSISRLRDAVMVLGLRTVKTLALGFSLVDQLKRRGGSEFDYLAFWERSLYTATAARTVAARSGLPEPEEAFLGGLMQGLGILSCEQALGDEYGAIYNAAPHDPEELCRLERDRFGFDHVVVSTALAERWNLPPSIAACLVYSGDPDAAPAESQPLVRIVAAAGHVADVFVREGDREALELYRLACQSWFRMDFEAADELLQEIDDHARVMRRLLELPEGSTPSAGQILAQANEALARISLETEVDNARLERERQELTIEASVDTLTGLANRREFERVLEQQVRLAQRYGFRVSLAMCDLDRFKQVNDTLGHLAGDEVLRQVACVIRENVRRGDTVARYGGEEFALIMPNTPLGGAASLANRVRAAVHEHVAQHEGRDIYVTISIGVATYDPRSEMTPEQVLSVADAALYAAKAAGRNTVRLGRMRQREAAA